MSLELDFNFGRAGSDDLEHPKGLRYNLRPCIDCRSTSVDSPKFNEHTDTISGQDNYAESI